MRKFVIGGEIVSVSDATMIAYSSDARCDLFYNFYYLEESDLFFCVVHVSKEGIFRDCCAYPLYDENIMDGLEGTMLTEKGEQIIKDYLGDEKNA